MIYELDISNATDWIAHTDWLGNPAEEYSVSQRETVLDFSVQEPGRGMKWSRHFDEPIDLANMPYMIVRYRAEGIAAYGDYFLYLNAKVGDSTKEFYVIMPGDLEDDGRWRTAIAEITPSTPSTGGLGAVNWMAVQVQAKTTEAHIQVKSIAFTSEKPILSLADILELSYDWKQAILSSDSFDVIDLSPYCNANSSEKLARMGLDKKWFESERVVADGIPFQTILNPPCPPFPKGGTPNLLSTNLNSVGTFTIPILMRAGEIYLLLGAYYEGNEEPSIGRGKLTKVKHVERFVIEIEYVDGVKDFVFPARISSNRYVIEAGVGVYRVVPTRMVDIKEIRIHDGMRQGEFYLAGLTIAKQFLAEPQVEKSMLSIQREKEKIIQPEVPINVDEHIIKFDNGYLRGAINISDGLTLTSLENGYTDAACLSEPSPLFAVKLEDGWITSSDFQVTDVSIHGGTVANLSLENGEIGASLTFSFNETHQLSFVLKLMNLSDAPIKLTPSFLTLRNIFITVAQVREAIPRIGASCPDCGTGNMPYDDQWYCFPRRGAVINNIPISLNEAYSGSFPMQFIDVYHPQLGGIYVMKHDLTDEYKWFKLKKDTTVSLQVDYMEKELQPGENILLPEAIIGSHAGDWHDAFVAYRQWVESWYQPLVPRKQWFREIFNFRQQFMHFELPRKSGIFDNDTKEYHFCEVIEKDIADFGGVDYLHIFDWGWSEKYGRCGDYDHWEQIGGAEAFRQAIEEMQEMEIPVGLYIEGYLVDPPSNIGKAHGEAWQLLGPDGKPYKYFAPSYNICSAVQEWQEYLSKTYARVWRETGVNGFYVDEMGFADPGHLCYNPNHGHPVPEPPLRGQRDLVRKVREALPPDVAVYTEESPVDVNSQYQDGSFTYAISSVSDDLSPTHLNLYRFAFPDFKTVEIITCDQPLGSDYQSVKRIFFNGEGIWIEGIADDWFTPENRAFIAKMHRVLKAHVKAFTSLNPTPLVPTLVSDVYANRFPAENETVWTLYNARYSTVRGELLAVPHQEGAKYYDAWNEQELNPRISQGLAYLWLELGPKDVGCVVQ
ncbi:hypothetical protein FJZ31_26125 [Candidatus Poribacteria bacterium]|nr:hypothetical protein [Candidatus Poribacteria bacterium]